MCSLDVKQVDQNFGGKSPSEMGAGVILETSARLVLASDLQKRWGFEWQDLLGRNAYFARSLLVETVCRLLVIL